MPNPDVATGVGTPPAGTGLGSTPPPPTPVAAGTSEYKVVKGDTFGTIAKKFPGVTAKAIEAANPKVDPTKLQINQIIQIPAPSAATSAPAPAAGSQLIYKVKSGDTLSKIATEHKTTVKALRNANNLKTDNIKVGQPLKIPVKAPAAAPTFDAAPGTAPTGQ
jgi:putative chitinase